eukprot:6181357-Pleurochrysis_carterae.AAC.1
MPCCCSREILGAFTVSCRHHHALPPASAKSMCMQLSPTLCWHRTEHQPAAGHVVKDPPSLPVAKLSTRPPSITSLPSAILFAPTAFAEWPKFSIIFPSHPQHVSSLHDTCSEPALNVISNSILIQVRTKGGRLLCPSQLYIVARKPMVASAVIAVRCNFLNLPPR